MAQVESGSNATAMVAIVILVLFALFVGYRFIGGRSDGPSLNVTVPG